MAATTSLIPSGGVLVQDDIGETRNLADEVPEKRVELSVKLSEWQEEIEGLGAPLDS